MFQKISGNVFAFISQGNGSNCFVLKGNKETALIDSSIEVNSKEIIEGLSKLALKPDSISLILHTHGHADHIGCDYFFPKAKIAMHAADAEKVNAADESFVCTSFFPETKIPKISISLKDRQEIGLGGLCLKVLHTPGHTAGSICFLLEKDGILFSGDTLFNEGFGRTDLPTGSSEKILQSLCKLQKTPFKTLLPGHGAILQGEKENRAALNEAIETLD